MKIVTRLTIQMEDTGVFYKLVRSVERKELKNFFRGWSTHTENSFLHFQSQSPNLKRFDILAIEPMDEKIMNQFCGGQLDCDILCLTMSTRLVIDLKRANLTLVSQEASRTFVLTLTSNFRSDANWLLYRSSLYLEEFVSKSIMVKHS